MIGLAYRVVDIYLADLEPDYSLGHGADLRRTLAGSDPGWIVLYYPNHISPQRYALLRESGFRLAKRFKGWVDWTNGDVEVWKKTKRRTRIIHERRSEGNALQERFTAPTQTTQRRGNSRSEKER